VQGHAGITDFTAINNANSAAALEVLIVEEELRNFVGENGADWFALRRLPLTTIQTIQPLLKSTDRFLLPIPYAEITENGSMVQNPGY